MSLFADKTAGQSVEGIIKQAATWRENGFLFVAR